MHHPTHYYSIASQQYQPHSTQWISSPSFYNAYTINTPQISVNQHKPVVQPYHSVVNNQHIASPYFATMKSYNYFRNAFSRSNNNSDQEYYYHEQQLNRNLSEHDIVRLPVKGDGNCLFYALAEGLMYEMKVDSNDFGLQIRRLFRLPINFRLVEFADGLRQICVEQWRLHQDYYSQFIDQEKYSFLKEVKKFSKNGVSDSILGDIVPLTMANTLNIKITIFTSLVDLPRIDVKPEHNDNLLPSSRKTIYLAYNQYGIGHYDAAYPRN